MKLTSLFLSLIIAGSMFQPEVKNKRDVPIQEQTKEELRAKTFKIGRALIDISMGLIIMDGARYELEDGIFEFSKFEVAGISLFAHGGQELYRQIHYRDLKAFYTYLISKLPSLPAV